MAKEIIIDTGFFIALFCKTDSFHQRALDLRDHLKGKKWMTTWPVLTETAYLMHKRNLHEEFEKLLNLYEKEYLAIFNLTPSHTSKLQMILKKYRKLPIDLADASLVILAEELGHGEIVSTDQRHFGAYRWKNHKPFINIL